MLKKKFDILYPHLFTIGNAFVVLEGKLDKMQVGICENYRKQTLIRKPV